MEMKTATTQPTSVPKSAWIGLFAVLAATIMNILDSTIVNVAAPAIRADLGATYSELQWIAAGYTLALAVGLLTGGRLGDMFGRKRILMIGLVGFVAASLSCSAAWAPEALVASRVVQGLFGAIMIPQCFGLLRDLFGPHVGKAFAAFGPIIGLSTILGPVVAGLLTDGAGWRAVFAINLPIGLFALIAGAKSLPLIDGRREGGLDVLGALIAGAGMFLLVFPLVQGRELGWPMWTVALAISAIVAFGIFTRYQISRKAKGKTPLVQLSVFAKRSYTSGVVFVVVFFGAIVGFSLAVGLFLQLGLGQSPIRASLTMAAWAVGAFLGSGFGATMMAKLGRHILHIGLSMMAAGLALLYPVFGDFSTLKMALPMALYGIGMGMIFVPLFDIIMGEIKDREVGSASSMLESIQQMGASLGVAVLGTVFFTTVGQHGFVAASKQVTLIALVLTVVALALAFLLPRQARAHAAPARSLESPETSVATRVPVLV
ncbi:MAG TPA: MFS transporter [Candidatus Limnocylindrales bacterium]|nr:MFS transporter [Candidatus Limnocylindrales bacterium]